MTRERERPLHVGLVIGQLTTGGAEGQLRLLCEGLDRRAVRPIVYCLSRETEPYGPLLEAAGVPVHVLAGGRLGRAVALRRRLAVDRVDVVHAWLFIANAYAWAASQGGGPVLVTSARNCKRQGRVLDAVNRAAFRASAGIVVNSEQVARYIAHEYGAPRERIAVIYNAIDATRFRPRGEGPPRGGPCVAMVGRLVTQKNPSLFVAAAAAVRRQVPAARFLLIGDGPLRGRVEAEVAAAGLRDCCTLAGERGDVDVLLREADLFWLTSDWEGLPNAVLEALATGLPVVATDVGGTAELVRSGQEGYVVPAGDRDALVARSVELLADDQKRARFARAARARAEQFDTAHMVAAMHAMYERACAGQGT